MPNVDRLYHLAEVSNLASIRTHGLMSTERLLALTGIAASNRATILRRHRPDSILLADGIMIRDQRPMPPTALSPALDDGLKAADWYQLLNSFVFLWPDRDRMERQRAACGTRPQVVLTFDAKALFERFGAEAFVSPINSGNARRKPARRGPKTFVPYARWLKHGWPTGQRTRRPAEFVFRCELPAQPPYLMDIA